jgi:16S rRNA (cytosine1407-C5)-methyltransferase
MNSLPSRFIERSQKLLPKNEWEDFWKSITQPLPKIIRVAQNFKKPDHWKLSPTAIPESFFLEREDQSHLPLGKTQEHFVGQIYVQSLSSMLPVIALDPKPEEEILDLCAAPGSKTTFLAQKMKNTGLILANEVSSSRSAKLASNLDRMGIKNVIMTQNDGRNMNTFFDQKFDRVLLDAPCSSEGFGRRDAHFFEKMWHEKSIFEAAKLQKKLIISAFEMLRVGGEMVYSTCTTAPEENEAVVEFLFHRYQQSLEILPIHFKDIPISKGIKKFKEQKFSPKIWKNVVRIWPHHRSKLWDSECFFLAKIKKIAPTLPFSHKKSLKRTFKNSSLTLKKNKTTEILKTLSEKFGIDPVYFEKMSIIKHSHGFSFTTAKAGLWASQNPHRRCGLTILDMYGNITSSFAIHFGHLATKNIYQLNEKQKKHWLQGYDLILDETFDSGKEILVYFQNICLGHGKVHHQKLKNKLKRNQVL